MFRTRPLPKPNRTFPNGSRAKKRILQKVDFMEGRALETGEHSDLKGGELIK